MISIVNKGLSNVHKTPKKERLYFDLKSRRTNWNKRERNFKNFIKYGAISLLFTIKDIIPAAKNAIKAIRELSEYPMRVEYLDSTIKNKQKRANQSIMNFNLFMKQLPSLELFFNQHSNG